MRIAIDARMIEHTGIGTYVRGLLGAFAAHGDGLQYVVFAPSHCVDAVPAAAHFEVRPVRIPVYSLAEHTSWPHIVDAAACDLLHVPHYNAPWWSATPCVVTAHDVVHLLYPHSMRSPLHAWVARRWLQHSTRRAVHVVTGAAAAARDLHRLLGIEPERMTVVAHGIDARFRPPAPADVERFRRAQALPSRFLLYVGLQRPHKNLARLVRAFTLHAARGRSDLELVLWGRADAGDRDLEAALATAGSRVQRRDTRLAAADMPLLYGAAHALVQPSLYEGFGLPPLEAMACGVPVLCSDGGALPEVVGDAALVVDRDDTAAMAAAIDRLAEDAALRAALVARGRARARAFTWERSAQATARVYRAAIAGAVTV
jgi:glycosyltransferase involved in cell wall biosynthesis